MKPRLLDLFCGAGGAGMGYHMAGFEVTGVDLAPQPRYPFSFIQAGALEYVKAHGHEFDAIHASPPCQRYSAITYLNGAPDDHPELIAPTQEVLRQLGKPYVIENVAGARRLLRSPIKLCGTSFGLNVIRHRYFELGGFDILMLPPCQHLKKARELGGRIDPEQHHHTVCGNFSQVDLARIAMGINWMTRRELAEAIPPAYTRFIGAHLISALVQEETAWKLLPCLGDPV